MKSIQQFTLKNPITSVLILLVVFVTPLLLKRIFLGEATAIYELVNNLYRYISSFIILSMMIKMDWDRTALISTPMRNWGKYWYLALLPMLLIGLINLLSVEFGAVTITAMNLSRWLISSVGVGFFEEILLRGLCFYILYRAWAHTRSGLYKAAIVQAILFGLFHFTNLGHVAFFDVLLQVIMATAIGIGFAGLLIYTRSIWPGVFAHFFIDALGGVNQYFIDDYVQPEQQVAAYISAIFVIFLIITLPGLKYLKNGQLMQS